MPKVGYLLPTRERVMEGRHETASLLALAERAEGLGFDSLWVGDSLLARPRHALARRCRGLQGPDHGGPDGEDLAPLAARLGDGRGGLLRHLVALRVHDVARDVVG